MIPELGHFALVLALVLAVVLAVVPMAASFQGRYAAMRLAPTLATAVAVFTSISFACLATAFLQDDFSGMVLRVPSIDLREIKFSWQLPQRLQKKASVTKTLLVD